MNKGQMLDDIADLFSMLLGQFGNKQEEWKQQSKLQCAVLAKKLKLATADDMQDLQTLLVAIREAQTDLHDRLAVLERRFGVTVKQKKTAARSSGKKSVNKKLR